MAVITFQFLKSHKDIILRTLEFEGDGSDINNTDGSIQRNIVGLLDINVYVEGKKAAIGKTWSLIVSFNGKPIITSNGTGTINAPIGKNGTSAYYGAHAWYV